jgi:hypothetical protein
MKTIAPDAILRSPAIRNEFRYGVVLLEVLNAVFFSVLVPDGTGARVLVAAMLGVTLGTVVLTSDKSIARRRLLATVILVPVLTMAVLVVSGQVDHHWPPSALATVLVSFTIYELVSGMLRLLRGTGVNLQAVFGGLAIYLLLGLWFGMVIGVIADASPTPYFVGGSNGDMSDHIYFSFTTLTTTGFGDPVAATQPGKALAVMEMLVGQIYLVTVIALLVSRARAGRGQEPASP